MGPQNHVYSIISYHTSNEAQFDTVFLYWSYSTKIFRLGPLEWVLGPGPDPKIKFVSSQLYYISLEAHFEADFRLLQYLPKISLFRALERVFGPRAG